MLEILNGVISNAEQFASPNANERPDAVQISLLVLHNISLPAGNFETECVAQLFMNELDVHAHPSFSSLQGLCVSAHVFIRRNGTLQQFVNLNARAWHAGESSFKGENNCNDFSIGIELEGCDDIAYTQLQYNSLVELSAAIMKAYPAIGVDRITGHCDIAPTRKTDPGAAFDWPWYRCKLLERIGVE